MIQFNRFDFRATWQSDALMPAYWGSALRGGLGKWLRQTSCILRTRGCDGCAVRASCAYGFIFETENIQSDRERGNINARPHPIVVELPFPCDFSTNKGMSFDFSILLMNRANEFFHHVLFSIVKLGQEDGIGARARQGYGRFQVDSVRCGEEVVYDRKSAEIKKPSAVRKLNLQEMSTERKNEDAMGRDKLEVGFETPFRAKYKGRFSRKVPFHLLIRTALRRISSLETAYGQGEPDLDYSGLIKAAEEVKTVREELQWAEVPRFSSRQKSKMMIGGPVGTVTYQGEDVCRFLPFLKYCEDVHLGKQTFFGLGKIRVIPE